MMIMMAKPLLFFVPLAQNHYSLSKSTHHHCRSQFEGHTHTPVHIQAIITNEADPSATFAEFPQPGQLLHEQQTTQNIMIGTDGTAAAC